MESKLINACAARLFLLGEVFEALVTGAAEKGTWVRIMTPPVEGRLTVGFQGVDVGDQLKVRLTGLDVERGFIDFANSGHDRTTEASKRKP